MGNLANMPNQNTAQQSKSEGWKAEAFVNVKFVDPNTNIKYTLGGLPMRSNQATHAKVLEILRNDPEAIERLKDHLVLEFNEVNSQEPDISF